MNSKSSRAERLLQLRKIAQEAGFNLVVVNDFLPSDVPILTATSVILIYGIYVTNGRLPFGEFVKMVNALTQGDGKK